MINYSKDPLPGVAEKLAKMEAKININKLKSLDPRIKPTKVDLKKILPDRQMALSYGIDWQGKPSVLMGCGDYSVITGLGKSKKSFFKSMIEASYIAGSESDSKMPFRTHRRGDQIILSIDTEQDIYDIVTNGKRVLRMIEGEYKNLKYFDWSLETPTTRVELLASLINCYKSEIGLIVLDGYIDFVEDYNNNQACFEFQQKIMEWSKKYRFHITGILHKNPNGEKMIGHLGSIMERKAASVISLSKNPENPKQSLVKHEKARGMEFDPFEIEIIKGLPHKVKTTL